MASKYLSYSGLQTLWAKIKAFFLPLTGGTLSGWIKAPSARFANTWYGISFGRTTGTPVETILYTGIKWTSSSHMPVVHITGYAYGLASPVEFKIGFYIYNGKIGWSGCTNMGSWKPDIYLFKNTVNGVDYVAVGLAGSCYYLQLSADLQDEMGKFANVVTDSAAWSWSFLTSTGTIPATDDGTTCVKVPYKADILGVTAGQNTTNADHYVTFVDSNNSTRGIEDLYTTSKLKVNPSTGDITTSGKVMVGTGGTNSYLASDSSTNIYLKNSTGAVLVCDGAVVRRGASVTSATLGNSSYYWAGVYSKLVSIDSNSAGAAIHLGFNRANFNYINVPTGGTLAVSINGSGGTNTFLAIDSSAVYPGYHNATVNLGTTSYYWKNVYGDSFIKKGGTSSQFLKADGSVDSNTYLTSVSEMSESDITAICT